MSSGKDRVIRAAQQCEEEGHHRDDGKWVDPLPVQEVAIHEGFRRASDDDAFDVWTVVNKRATLREGDTVAENFERVFEQWDDQVNSPEIVQAVEDALDRMRQEEGG